MRFVSVDIETTGLNPEKHEVIEVGAVVVDTMNDNLDNAARMRFLIPAEDYLVNAYCAKLHYDLWQELSVIKNPDQYVSNGNYRNYRGQCPGYKFGEVFSKWCTENGIGIAGPIAAGGKNFSSFDKVFLEKLPNFTKEVRFMHRAFDPAPLFTLATDATLPNLDTCLKRAGIPKQTDHTALADALCVGELAIIGLKILSGERKMVCDTF